MRGCWALKKRMRIGKGNEGIVQVERGTQVIKMVGYNGLKGDRDSYET